MIIINKKRDWVNNRFLMWAVLLLIVLLSYLGESLLKINGYEKYLFSFSQINDLWNTRIDLFLAQLSTTFITVSLLSVLSDKHRYYLWVDLVEKALIEPRNASFLDLSIYAFISLGVNITSLLFNYPVVFFLFFCLGLLSLTYLSFKMIRIYFLSSTTKDRIINTYIHDDVVEKAEKMKRLQLLTSEAVIANDYVTYNTNFEFIIDYVGEIEWDVLENMQLIAEKHGLDFDVVLAQIRYIKAYPYDERATSFAFILFVNVNIKMSEKWNIKM